MGKIFIKDSIGKLKFFANSDKEGDFELRFLTSRLFKYYKLTETYGGSEWKGGGKTT